MSGGPGCFSCKVKAAIRCGLPHGKFVKIACVKIHLKCPTGGFYQSVGAGFHPRPQNFIFADVGRTKPFRAQSESRVSVRVGTRKIKLHFIIRKPMSGGPGCFSCKVKAAIRCASARAAICCAAARARQVPVYESRFRA